MLRELAALPLAEDIPIAHNSCRRGPRSVGWRDDRPAEMDWIEAQARAPRGAPRMVPVPAAAVQAGAVPVLLSRPGSSAVEPGAAKSAF